MVSTNNSLLKKIADATGVNKKFSREENHTIDTSLLNITSPVEAILKYHGNIDKQGYIISKYGKKVVLDSVIGKYAEKFSDGIYLNLYLSPLDNHHFFLPYGGTVQYIQNNQGKARLPFIVGLDHKYSNQKWFSKALVNNASIGIIVNSRKFSYAMIAVGSLNVNNITVETEIGKKYQKGFDAGHFSIGSTVLLCFDKSLKDNSELLIKNGMHTAIGQPIMKIQPIYKS